MIDYFYIAEAHFKKSGEWSQRIEYICKGIVKLIKMAERKKLTFSNTAFRTIIMSFPDKDIRKQLLAICTMNLSTENDWKKLLNAIKIIFSAYIDWEKIKDHSFVEWQGNNIQENEDLKVVNQKQYVDEDTGRCVELKFGSIHSSKGKTHLSTLIVETKYYEYNLESILPWLTGKRKKLGKRNEQRLKCQYVAMTRAKGLICLAIQKASVSDETRKKLSEYGWNVEDV